MSAVVPLGYRRVRVDCFLFDPDYLGITAATYDC